MTISENLQKLLQESPCDPLYGVGNLPKDLQYISMSAEDSYTWVIRKPGLYFFGRPKDDVYHESINRFIEYIIEQKVTSKSEIEERAKAKQIGITGKHDSYEDFVTKEDDYRNMGYLTGRIWVSRKIVSAYDDDKSFLKRMPEVGKMIMTAFKIEDPGGVIIDLQTYRQDNVKYENVKRLKDVFSGASVARELTAKEKEMRDLQVALHTETNPYKRKAIRKKLGLDSEQSFKHGLPPIIRSYLKRDPKILRRIDWSKWGLSKSDAREFIRNAEQLMEEERLNESPDSLSSTKFPKVGRSGGLSREDAFTFTALTEDVILVTRVMDMNGPFGGTHQRISRFIEDIIDFAEERGESQITEEFIQRQAKIRKIRIIGKLTFGLAQHVYDNSPNDNYGYLDERKLGIFTGRLWTDLEIISIWQSNDYYRKYLRTFATLLKVFGVSASDILKFKIDLDGSNEVITFRDVLDKQLDSVTSDEKLSAMKQAHIEVDPGKRKALKRKMGMLSQRSGEKLPKMVISALRRNPELFNTVDFSKWGISPEDAERLVMGLGEDILSEDPDNLEIGGKRLGPKSADSIAFGYINGIVFYKVGGMSNHQQIYYELKSRLAPNYPKLAKAIEIGRYDAVNHFIKQIIGYLDSRGIVAYGDYSNLPEILRDINDNDVESLDITGIMGNLDSAGYKALQSNAYSIRKDVFEISGRAWGDAKICSFWNPVSSSQRCLGVFNLILERMGGDIKDFGYEFIDNIGVINSYEDVKSGSVKTGKVGDMRKLHDEPDPHKKAALRKSLKGDKSNDEYWKDRKDQYQRKGGLSSWERERARDLAEGITDVFDNKNGAGAVPFNQEIDYMGFVKQMSVKDFRTITPSGVSGPKTKGYIIQHIKNGGKIGTPFLEVKWDEKHKVWQTVGHEGRSRADALSEIFGPETMIPVHIFPGSGMRARHLTDEMKKALILPQRDNIY